MVVAKRDPKVIMCIVSIAQQKGGVGKTTAVANLGAAFAGQGRRVLVVDCDPQGSLSLALGCDPLEVTATIGDAMLQGAPLPLQQTSTANLWLVPASRQLADAEFLLAPKVGREKFLSRVLEKVRSDYDLILLDTPPSLGLLTVNCLVAAQWLLVPVTPALLGAAGMRDLLETVEEIKSAINPSLRIAGAFISFADRRSVAGKRLEAELREDLGDMVMEHVISRRIAHEYAAQAGTPIVSLEPRSSAAVEYIELAQEIAQRVQL